MLLLGVLVFVVPPVVENALVHRLERAASSRGIELRYQGLEWGLGGVNLTDVRAEHARGHLTLRRAEVGVRWRSLLLGDVHVERVRLVEPRAHLDVTSAKAERRSTVASKLATIDWPTLPRIDIVRPALTINDGAERALLSGSGSYLVYDPDEHGRIQAQGTVSVRGVGDRSLELDGWYLGGELNLAVGAAHSAEPLFDGAIEGVGHLVVEKARLEGGNESGPLVLKLDGVSGSRGPLRFVGARVGLVPAGGRIDVRIRGGRVVMAEASGDGIAPAGRGKSTIDGRWRAYADRIRLDVEGVGFEKGGQSLVEHISASWDQGVFEAWIPFADGVVEVSAEVPSWTMIPSSLAVRGRALRVSDIERLLESDPLQSDENRVGGRLDFLGAVTGLVDELGRPSTQGDVRFDGWASLHDGRLHASGIAGRTVKGIELQATLGGRIEGGRDAAEFEGSIASGPLQLNVTGQISTVLEDPTVDLTVKGRPVPCQKAFSAIPKSLLGPYGNAQLEGTFAPRIRLHWPYLRPWALELRFRDVFRACRVESLAAEKSGQIAVRLGGKLTSRDDVDWLNRGFALRVSEGVSGGADVWVGPGVSGYVPLVQLPRYVGAAAYLSEEVGFYHNRPIDRGLITRALRLNLEHGRFVYGGSTVTQQLVKNLFLSRQKTLARKLQEVLIATRITTTVSRERVLELYLNCIEFGPNIYGIGRAARYYFQKDARHLTPREAVFLAMLKPAPRRGAWMKRRGYTPLMPYWNSRAEQIFGRLVDKGYLSASQAQLERPYALRWVDGQYQGRDQPSTL